MARRLYTWEIGAGATKTTQLDVNRVKFGDGYAQTTTRGINNVRESWRIIKFGYEDEINTIHDFLTDHLGAIAFDMVLDKGQKPYITDGEIVKSHVGGDVWQISFAVTREFIP